jgi:hypothetical protein
MAIHASFRLEFARIPRPAPMSPLLRYYLEIVTTEASHAMLSAVTIMINTVLSVPGDGE